MAWFASNWRRVLMAAAVAVGALTADHTVAHKISDAIVGWLPQISF